jgi:hypothetical protein
MLLADSLHRHFLFFGVHQCPSSAPQANSVFIGIHRNVLLSTDFAVSFDSVGEFVWMLYAAGLLCFKASAAKQETCVGRSDGSMSQETRRLTLIAVAVIRCWRFVFGNPK